MERKYTNDDVAPNGHTINTDSTMKSLAAVIVCSLCAVSFSRADLYEYVKQKDESFQFSVKQKTESDSGTAYRIEMTSQTWQGIKWEHVIMMYLPPGKPNFDSILLWNDGGRPDAIKSFIAFELCKRSGVPVAFLYGIPNQPLFEGKREDALIAETFIRFLKTGDENWPLLFPMVKSLVRAMDAIQATAKKEWDGDIKKFVVTGASKRGWTSWLTGAADGRVKAIAPLVIDMLNFDRQLPHQITSFGKPSEMIRDYTERGLIPIPKTTEAERLWKMVDPFMHREKVTMPKMIINGTNDPYWPQDATNLYWDDLKGDKWLLYVPNAGHGLEQTYADGQKDRTRVLSTLALFARQQIRNLPMPKLTWSHDEADGKSRVVLKSDVALSKARIWTADSASRDFRKSKWTESAAQLDGKSASGTVAKPTEGWRTHFLEAEFEQEGNKYYLSTQLRMVESGKK